MHLDVLVQSSRRSMLKTLCMLHWSDAEVVSEHVLLDVCQTTVTLGAVGSESSIDLGL